MSLPKLLPGRNVDGKTILGIGLVLPFSELQRLLSTTTLLRFALVDKAAH
jgi:hypothetical protein